MGKTGLLNIVASALLATGCATKHIAKQEQMCKQSQDVVAELDAMTAAGQFSTIAAYVHRQIDQYPSRYINELYDGAEVALNHAPNGVYQLAVQQYAEDVREYFDAQIYVMEQMRDNGGFSFTYDLDYDE